jgi:FlaA1/EpsC-like NDP-sugar epimerase
MATNKDFLNNTFENFLHCAQTKKLVLFGAGAEMCRVFSAFLECNDLKPAYIVDNDFRKWYSRVFGYKICEPSVLREESVDELVILITSLCPYRIKEQLEHLGILHYYSSLLFIENNIGKTQFIVNF